MDKVKTSRPRIRKIQPGSVILPFILICSSVVAIFPFWTMMMMGTYYSNDIYKGIKILPGTYMMENFKTLTTINFGQYYLNSFTIGTFCSLLTVLVCSMAGFGFAKYRFRGKTALMGLVMVTLMVPVQLGLVGFVIQMNAIGWLSTLLPLIIPNSASAFGVYWMTSYTTGAIPDSVIESARIDGCNDLRVYLQIALPFMIPACATLLLLSFLWSFNAYLVPAIIISEDRLYTVTIGIRQLGTQFRNDVGAQIFGLSIATIPMLLVFSIFSKYLITGLSASAVKE